jgi:hypothetical protein
MSSAADDPAGHDPDRPPANSTPAGRKRGRVLIPGVIIAAILIVFAFILLVSKCGGDAGEIYGRGADAALSAPVASLSGM